MSITLQFTFKVGGVLTNATSATLSDPTSTYGVKRDDTGATVVADSSAMTNTSTGIYQYSFTEPTGGLSYTYYVEWVYGGETHYSLFTYVDSAASGSWTLSKLRSRFRTLTGRGTTNDISDSDCNAYINEYLQYRFPIDVQLDRFDDDYTQELSATDSGEYSLSENILSFQQPVFINDEEVSVYYDKESFWRIFPSDEDWITAPTLAVGTTSGAAVANSAFKYMGQDGRVRSKTATETALSGDSVPVSKYGAWFLEIDDDGTVAVQEADDNATGYDSAALAIDGLPGPSSGCTVMGFVTAINTAGAFVPGTTLLSAATVTDTYTDGHPGYRGQPDAVLVNRSQGKLYVRPKPDDFYILKSMASLTRPAELSGDSSAVSDEAWGPVIALGAAIDYLNSQAGEEEQVALLDHGGDRYSAMNPGPGSFQMELVRLTTKEARQIAGRQIRRAW